MISPAQVTASMTSIDYAKASALYQAALQAGVHPRRPGAIEWDLSRGCESPATVHLEGRPDPLDPHHRGKMPGPIFLDLQVACRRCATCQRHRRRLWTARGMAELRLHPRSWFVTLTIRPTDRHRILEEARYAAARAAVGDLDACDEATRWRYLQRAIRDHLTKMLKRLRHNAAARFRYLMVAEKHRDGFPHYHLLIHEYGFGTLTKRQIESEWSLGFTSAKLVRNVERAARYVAKYCAKSLGARVRASQRYGNVDALTALAAAAAAARTIIDPPTPTPVGHSPYETQRSCDLFASKDAPTPGSAAGSWCMETEP